MQELAHQVRTAGACALANGHGCGRAAHGNRILQGCLKITIEPVFAPGDLGQCRFDLGHHAVIIGKRKIVQQRVRRARRPKRTQQPCRRGRQRGILNRLQATLCPHHDFRLIRIPRCLTEQRNGS